MSFYAIISSEEHRVLFHVTNTRQSHDNQPQRASRGLLRDNQPRKASRCLRLIPPLVMGQINRTESAARRSAMVTWLLTLAQSWIETEKVRPSFERTSRCILLYVRTLYALLLSTRTPIRSLRHVRVCLIQRKVSFNQMLKDYPQD